MPLLSESHKCLVEEASYRVEARLIHNVFLEGLALKEKKQINVVKQEKIVSSVICELLSNCVTIF